MTPCSDTPGAVFETDWDFPPPACAQGSNMTGPAMQTDMGYFIRPENIGRLSGFSIPDTQGFDILFAFFDSGQMQGGDVYTFVKSNGDESHYL